MMPLDDIRIYLPKYLSAEAVSSLFAELRQFPENIESRFYSDFLAATEDEILQGDGLVDLPIVNLPDSRVAPGKAAVISNSCDINPDNQGLFAASICYCPIFNLTKYEEMLRARLGSAGYARVDQFVKDVRQQKITQIFFLPRGGSLEYEGFVFFDKVCSCANTHISRSDLKVRRLFSLSNYGFYLFLLKLSIHFTRVRESLDRK